MDNEKTLPKNLTIFDRLKTSVKKLFGYREGEKFTLNVMPEIINYSDIEIGRIANIEQKLRDCLHENNAKQSLEKGIEIREAQELLQWVVQNARKELFKDEDPKEESLQGACGWSQAITGTTLMNMGLQPYIVNTLPTLSKKTGRHAFLAVGIPVREEGQVVNKMYLVDATFKQFFERNHLTNMYNAWIKDKRYGGRVAPLAGYWVLQMGKKGLDFAEEILTKGYIELTEENAKLYGDSFYLEGVDRKDHSKVPSKKELITGIPGSQYIENIMKPEN